MSPYDMGAAPSPFRHFSRAEWAQLRAGAPLNLRPDDLERLRALDERLSMDEVSAIYMPLARLLGIYVASVQGLHRSVQGFLGKAERKVPYIIGIAGSVAVGKSTTARVLQALLQRWPTTPQVELITTDGFLFPNAVLEQRGLMEKKGFPASYDINALLAFLSAVKAGKPQVSAPVYSHIAYDIVPDKASVVDQPDILILEGLNLFQTQRPPRDGRRVPFVSDFIDFALYLDAQESHLLHWYVERFRAFRETAFRDPRSYFKPFAKLSEAEVTTLAMQIWRDINSVNLHENILPTRARAHLILTKGANHAIESVALRRL